MKGNQFFLCYLKFSFDGLYMKNFNTTQHLKEGIIQHLFLSHFVKVF